MKVLSIGLDNSILDKSSGLARRAVEYGNLVEIYTVIVPGGSGEEIILSDKVKVYGAGKGNKIFKFFKIFRLAAKVLKIEKYDLITVQDQYYLAWLAYKLSRKFKLGLEIQVHGFEKYSGLRKVIAKFTISKANAIRVVSQRLRKQLVNNFKVDDGKVTVVPIYAQCTTHNVERTTHNKKFVFLTVGRLVEVKNIEMQIEAMKEIAKEYKNTELWIVGDGPLISNFKFQISPVCRQGRNLKLDNRIKLLGQQDNLEKFYEQADAFLLTSNAEGWGLVVVEAASFGLPIIMTDVGCASELIKNEESGIVIPVGDEKELIKAMRRIIEDSSLRKKLGAGARQAVEKLPSKEETLKLYLKSWQIAKKCK